MNLDAFEKLVQCQINMKLSHQTCRRFNLVMNCVYYYFYLSLSTTWGAGYSPKNTSEQGSEIMMKLRFKTSNLQNHNVIVVALKDFIKYSSLTHKTYLEHIYS